MDFTTAASIKRIFYLLIIVAAALFIYYSEFVKQPIWLLFASYFLAHATLEEPLLRRTFIIIMSGLFAAICVVVGGLVSANLTLVVIYLAIVTALCSWRGMTQNGWAYPMLIVNIIAVLSVHKAATLLGGGYRALAIADAVIIVADAQIILLPFFAGSEYNRNRKITFYHLRNYAETLLSCLMEQDYPDNIYVYERELHKQKVKCMHGILTMHNQETKDAVAEPGFHAEDLQNIFEILVDISQIRRRVSDHTVYGLCLSELSNIETSIKKMFNAMAANHTAKMKTASEMLKTSIEHFDDSFESVVKVAAREPMVFVLFAASLKALQQTIEQQVTGRSETKVEQVNA